MAGTAKPSLTTDRIWANGATGGDINDPGTTKYGVGWILNEVPEYPDFNYLQQQFTQGLVYNNEQGINEWDTNTVYPIHALAKGSAGRVYRALSQQNGNDPTSTTLWLSTTDSTTAELINRSLSGMLTETIITTGFTTVGDDGGGLWKHNGTTGQTASQTPAQLQGAIFNDASGNQWALVGSITNIKALGAKGDGSTVDTLVIQGAIESVFASGPGKIGFPDGTYIVDASASSETWPLNGGGTKAFNTGCLILKAGVFLVGETRASTIIKTNDPSKGVIMMSNPTNSGVMHMTLDGSFVSTGAGSGFDLRVAVLTDDVDGLTLIDLHIKNVGSYGIGLNNGFLTNCTVRDIITDFTGSDGMDAKSRSATLTEIDLGNTVDNFKAMRFGQRISGATGVDLRGSWNATNLNARNFGGTGVSPWTGIRTRSISEANNQAQRTNINNIVVDCGGNANTFGLKIGGKYCNIANVSVLDPVTGVQFDGNGTEDAHSNTLSNVVVTGHSGEALEISSTGVDNAISNFVAANANGAARHFRIEGAGTSCANTWGDLSAAIEFSVESTARTSFTNVGGNSQYKETLDLTQSTTGQAKIEARGPTTNIDINLTPKGAGHVKFGTRTAIGAETVTGFITIEDEDGNVRKLAVVA